LILSGTTDNNWRRADHPAIHDGVNTGQLPASRLSGARSRSSQWRAGPGRRYAGCDIAPRDLRDRQTPRRTPCGSQPNPPRPTPAYSRARLEAGSWGSWLIELRHPLSFLRLLAYPASCTASPTALLALPNLRGIQNLPRSVLKVDSIKRVVERPTGSYVTMTGPVGLPSESVDPPGTTPLDARATRIWRPQAPAALAVNVHRRRAVELAVITPP
jgi:hypothetical protein